VGCRVKIENRIGGSRSSRFWRETPGIGLGKFAESLLQHPSLCAAAIHTLITESEGNIPSDKRFQEDLYLPVLFSFSSALLVQSPNLIMYVLPPSDTDPVLTGYSRVVFALIIINKAGGLIYQKDFAAGLNKLTINDYLVLAGTFHGVHAITTRLHPLSHHTQPSSPDIRPEPPSGIEVLETENFRLQCFSTLTGTKFLLFTEPQQPNVDKIVARIYELYGDYVMKNPFYQLEMPVRCEAFDRKLLAYIRPLNSR